MAAAQNGIEQFVFKQETVAEELEQYLFRFKMFLKANKFNIEDNEQDSIEAGATLLAFGGINIYTVLRAKKSKEDLTTMRFQAMVEILEQKYLVKDEKLAYCKFYKRKFNSEKEKFDDYVMSLRILAHAAGLMEDKHILYKIMVCDSSPKHVVKYARKSESTLDSLLKYIVEKEHED